MKILRFWAFLMHLESGPSVVSFEALMVCSVIARRGTQLVEARNSTQFRDCKGLKSYNMSHLNQAGLTSFIDSVMPEHPGG